jgi:hypothetical protein
MIQLERIDMNDRAFYQSFTDIAHIMSDYPFIGKLSKGVQTI